jgi:transglutaminase-like putative cysteine protease
MRYRVTHRTEYTYGSVVSSSYGELHLLPRDVPGQLCRSASVRIEPEPAELRERRDYFGNRVSYFSVLRPHTALTVTGTSEVDVQPRERAVPLLADVGWDAVRDRLRSDRAGEVLDARQFVLDSPLVMTSRGLAAYAAPSFPAGRPLADAVVDLASRIHRDFAYRPGATSVATTLDEVIERREGVCQDFAHLAIGCLRSLGLAARYVSGYLETEPPPGEPRAQGADVSHAWVSVFAPDAGWVDVDPTNDQLVDECYVVTAWGRDYGDVPPLKGVIYTEGDTNDLVVKVDVVPVEGGG